MYLVCYLTFFILPNTVVLSASKVINMYNRKDTNLYDYNNFHIKMNGIATRMPQSSIVVAI